MKVDSSTGYVRWGYNGVYNCRIEGVDASTLSLVASNNINAYCDSHDVYYEQDNDSADVHWRSYGDNLRMKLTAGGNVTADGSFTGGGADYAEYFESISGKSIPVGTTVILEGDKIRPAKKGEEPIGVISTRPSIIGNSESDAGENWQGKYLKNDFGEFIYEEADFWRLKKEKKLEGGGKIIEKLNGWCDEKSVPEGAVITKEKRRKINPAWNPNQEYIPRKDRSEWNIVGLIGQVRIKKNQPVSSRWIKMKEISENVDLYLIR